MDAKLERYIESSLTTALEQGHVQAYYQPVVRTISRKLCSFEALSRWVDPERGFIYPGDFIPVLERARTIHLLDIHIVNQVCARIRQSMDRGEVPIPVSINLSRLDFELCDIFNEVMRATSTHQVPRDLLYIEITESVMAERGRGMRKVIDRFRDAGFQVWMDDFGSGYSSLNVLKDYAFDEIKLDMDFLSSFDQRSSHIVSSVIHMAKQLGIHTLMEGVETAEEYAYLHDIGCEKIQGYYFGKPMPFEEALAHLASTGIELERPAERAYYDDIGRVDFLSAAPFMAQQDAGQFAAARNLNSIPLAVGEVRQGAFTLLFFNAAFENTARGTKGLSDVFDAESLGVPQLFERLPKRVANLLDSTGLGETGRMFFIANEQYYAMQAKRVAQTRGAYCVLLRMDNLSKVSESEKTNRLDEGMRQIYGLYERVTLIDVEADSIMPLYLATREELIPRHSGLRALYEEYAKTFIYPEDREEYLEFADIATIEKRFATTNRTSVTALLRTRTRHGQYEWHEYCLLRMQNKAYFELVRNVHDEVVEFASRVLSVVPEALGVAGEDGLMSARVWKALVNSDLIKFFWKDKERRFLGASRGFLEYYGFDSIDDIRGKTDEDLGWHVQPGPYKSDELQVIEEGIATRNVPGHCMRNGENRDIVASKTPLYDTNGTICGLVGRFIDVDELIGTGLKTDEAKRHDILTGLLNSRGIHEEARIFRDEYFLRGTDFTCIYVSIDDMATINNQYGFDFGDKAITELGRALKQVFGLSAAVGRRSGHQLEVLCQVRDREEERKLRTKAKHAAELIRRVDGTALTLYVSVGSCLFSEVETLEEMSKRAEIRMLADQDEHASCENRKQRSSEIFHLYDNLPIAYCVLRVLLDDDNRVSDAVIFYVNHRFEESCGMSSAQLLGKGARGIFPEMEEDWYEKAYRAAYKGEIISDKICYAPTNTTYFMTASPVIHSGYCCFTYQSI